MRFLLLVPLLGVPANAAFAADPPKRWNLLIIMAVDMNADSGGWNGNKLGAKPTSTPSS
ncbi:MAG: hypothetical protein WCL32_14245 [Planctomycetota bacterium]|jgi:hypothetical protein